MRVFAKISINLRAQSKVCLSSKVVGPNIVISCLPIRFTNHLFPETSFVDGIKFFLPKLIGKHRVLIGLGTFYLSCTRVRKRDGDKKYWHTYVDTCHLVKQWGFESKINGYSLREHESYGVQNTLYRIYSLSPFIYYHTHRP